MPRRRKPQKSTHLLEEFLERLQALQEPNDESKDDYSVDEDDDSAREDALIKDQHLKSLTLLPRQPRPSKTSLLGTVPIPEWAHVAKYRQRPRPEPLNCDFFRIACRDIHVLLPGGHRVDLSSDDWISIDQMLGAIARIAAEREMDGEAFLAGLLEEHEDWRDRILIPQWQDDSRVSTTMYVCERRELYSACEKRPLYVGHEFLTSGLLAKVRIRAVVSLFPDEGHYWDDARIQEMVPFEMHLFLQVPYGGYPTTEQLRTIHGFILATQTNAPSILIRGPYGTQTAIFTAVTYLARMYYTGDEDTPDEQAQKFLGVYDTAPEDEGSRLAWEGDVGAPRVVEEGTWEMVLAWFREMRRELERPDA